jgi:hypothetical protein
MEATMNTDQARALIDYIEALEERTNHGVIMDRLGELGYSTDNIDDACRALGKIARRDFSIL